MSNHARPTLLGYIRADVLRDGIELPHLTAQLEAFADREEFNLGTVYVAQSGDAASAFHALMGEVTRDEAARGVVVPDLRHVTIVEELVLTGYEAAARTAIFTASFTPRAGGPGVDHPSHARSAVPPLRGGPGDRADQGA